MTGVTRFAAVDEILCLNGICFAVLRERLHAIPTSHNYRSGFLLYGESIYAMLDRLDDQHFIAASLKLIRYALDLYAETISRKMFAHKMEVWRWSSIKRK